MSRVLVVDDSPIDRRLVGGILGQNRDLSVDYAENGQAALHSISQSAPDVVLTDLQMPEMNGLELVEAIRDRWPLVPVLLMTAHGSEEIAVRALERGAASYVAKASLSRDLMDAVENLLAMARADRRSDRLRECLVLSEHAFVLDNDPALVAPLVDHFQELLSTMRLCDETGRIRAGIALEEALLNALYHGNLELDTEQLRAASVHLLDAGSSDLVRQLRSQAPYRDRRIHVLCRVTSTEATYTIRDDGPGFQPDSVPVPTGPSGLERERGRGLLLMRTFMDEVRYNERGNEVTLIKRREANR